MKPTPRLLRACAALVLLAACAVAFPALAPAAWTLDALLALLVCIDALRTPAPRRAEVERDLPERSGLSQPLLRRVRVRLHRPLVRTLEVHEEAPPSLHQARECARGRIACRIQRGDLPFNGNPCLD